MVILKLNDWVPINGIEQTGTTWQLAADKDFVNIVAELPNSADKLTLCIFDTITVPSNLVYYARAKRHFNDVNSDYWTAVKKVINTDNSVGILLEEPIVIEKPFVYIDDSFRDTLKATFTMKTSKFRGNDGHVCTHWLILSGVGKVLWSSIEDTVNLESIVVTKTADMVSKTRLKFVAIHVSTNNVESPVGDLSIELSNFNYEILSSLINIQALKDFVIEFNPIDTTKPTLIERVVVKDASDETILYSTNNLTNKITVPWYVLIANADLLLYVYAYDNNGNLTYSVKNMAVKKTAAGIEIIPEFVYDKVFNATGALDDVYIPNGVVAGEITNNIIYTPVFASSVGHKLVYDDVLKKYIDAGPNPTLSLLTSDVDNTYINYLESSLVLVDTNSSDGVPIFLVYKHNKGTDVFTLLHSKIRRDETTPVGKNNAIVQISSTAFIYSTHGSNLLRKYDISDNTLTDIGVIPLADYTNGAMFRISNNRVLIMGGSSFTDCIYKIDDNEFLDGISTVPGSFINRELKTHKLINNDVLIFKTDHLDGDTEHSVLYFNYNTSEFTVLDIVFEIDKFPKSTIGTLAGGIFLTRYNFKEKWEDLTNERVYKIFE